MRADQVEIAWDPDKNDWLLRITVGEEVIRRHCDASKDASEEVLNGIVQKTLRDEGYESEPAELKIRR